MQFLFFGPSSSGKSSLADIFPKSFTIVHYDDIYYETEKVCTSKLKNKFYSKKEKLEMMNKCAREQIAKKVKGKSSFIIDTVSFQSLRNEFSPSVQSILIYSNLDQMVNNYKTRRDRSLYIYDGYSGLYRKKLYNNEMTLDVVKLSDFITSLQKIKYEFENQKELIKFAKDIFAKMGITDNKPHAITPRSSEYNLIIRTKGKTRPQLRDKILKFFE